MKVKALLRFYFSADALENHLNNLIYRRALRPTESTSEAIAEEVIALIGAKDELSLLWSYLDAVLAAFSAQDKCVLKEYAQMRYGIARLPRERQKEVRRAAIKFTRHAERGLARYRRALDILSAYYCLL